MKQSILILVLATIQCSHGQKDLEGSISTCLSKKGNSLDSCLLELSELLRTYMTLGLPEYNVPPTEPMKLDYVPLHLMNKLINVSLEFSDTTVQGLSSFVLLNVTANKEENTIYTHLIVPQLRTRGDYRIQGRIGPLLLDDTSSQYKVDMEDVEVHVFVRLTLKNGKPFIENEPEISIPQIGDLDIELDGLFEGKPKLKEFAQNFINDSDKFIEDFGPQISKQIGELATGVYNAAIADLSPSLFGLQK